MAKIRRELAGLRVEGNDDLFTAAVEQLEALAGEIAGAADRVMTAGEATQAAADAIAAKTKERPTKTQVKRITANTVALFEACSFQDITGQRIAKITRTVGAIEGGMHAVATLAGGKDAPAKRPDAIDRRDGGIILEGPQIDGPAVSQTDIDKLFD